MATARTRVCAGRRHAVPPLVAESPHARRARGDPPYGAGRALRAPHHRLARASRGSVGPRVREREDVVQAHPTERLATAARPRVPAEPDRRRARDATERVVACRRDDRGALEAAPAPVALPALARFDRDAAEARGRVRRRSQRAHSARAPRWADPRRGACRHRDPEPRGSSGRGALSQLAVTARHSSPPSQR